ncbi:MAG: FG-GAP-like repeat-containing protein [Candidatus Caldipriscus sp.]
MKRVILTALSIGLMPVLGYGQSFPPVNVALGTWMMHHGSTSLRGVQLLRGAVTGPYVKCSYDFGSGGEGDPIIADINGDSLNEIVVAGWSNGSVWAFRGTDCSLLWSRDLGGSRIVTPAAGELNPSIPGLEIAVVKGNDRNVYVLRGIDGAVLWNRYIGGINFYGNISPPTIFDVDGNGVGEVYVVGDSIYALRGTNGSTIWSYPASGGFAAVAIADINNDGQYEVVTVGYSGGSWRVIVLRATDGAFLWDYTVGSQGNPAIADLDNDGYKEIVVATYNGMLYALRHNGTLYWSRNMGFGSNASNIGSINSPTIADLDGDGWKEIVYGHYYLTGGLCSSSYVRVLRGTDGSTIWSYSGPCSGYQFHSRKIADIDNDGQIEIILTGAFYGPSPYIVVLNGATGAVEWTYSDLPFEGLAIGDVDNDGCMEFVSTPDCCGATSFVVFDSPTPVSDCGILGDDEELKVEEERNIGGVYLLVSPVKGGVNVETGRKAFVEIYTTDGRKVRGLEVDRSAFVELKKGTYIFRVKGHNLYRTVIVR